jgi:hypothetical protein
MDLLRQAVGSCYRKAAAVRIETVLDPLRPQPDFRLLTMDLACSARPLAGGE